MSRIVSLRLDENDPDEARALAILDRLIAEGHTVREIVAAALLQAEGAQLTTRSDPAEMAALVLDQAQATLATAARLVAELQKGGTAAAPSSSLNGAQPISDELRAAVRKAAKPGLRLE